jgi:hypothetical protein
MVKAARKESKEKERADSEQLEEIRQRGEKSSTSPPAAGNWTLKSTKDV